VKEPQGRNSPAAILLALIVGCRVRVFGAVSDSLAIVTSDGDITNLFLVRTVDGKATRFSHFDKDSKTHH
jgi:hypothetical protein